jgi:CRP-like cAMP-binding protein
MIELLFENISGTIQLTDEDKSILKEYFLPKKLRKKQYFLQEGNVAFHTAWVAKGCMRTFSVNKNGIEQTMQLAIEGWWATDMYSFLTGEPAMYNIEAVEDCELLVIDKVGREKVFERVPGFERLMRILIEKNLVANQQRLNALMGQNADERYISFIKKYPQIVQRVPQHMIASYLGITPETLSRIRKQLSE